MKKTAAIVPNEEDTLRATNCPDRRTEPDLRLTRPPAIPADASSPSDGGRYAGI